MYSVQSAYIWTRVNATQTNGGYFWGRIGQGVNINPTNVGYFRGKMRQGMNITQKKGRIL